MCIRDRATPFAVKRAALAAFVVAGAAGLALAAVAGWWLVGVGAACVAAAWFYTGGPRPYGYVGLGELAVFCFFGLVATVGTAYVQTGEPVSYTHLDVYKRQVISRHDVRCRDQGLYCPF